MYEIQDQKELKKSLGKLKSLVKFTENNTALNEKRGKEQIVIGLVMADGIPIHHEVWKGNTIDNYTRWTHRYGNIRHTGCDICLCWRADIR